MMSTPSQSRRHAIIILQAPGTDETLDENLGNILNYTINFYIVSSSPSNFLIKLIGKMRVTRSMASGEAATSKDNSAKPSIKKKSAAKKQKNTANISNHRSTAASLKDAFAVSKAATSGSKRKAIHEVDINELPHNLGKPAVVTASIDALEKTKSEENQSKRIKLESPAEKNRDKVASAITKRKKSAAQYGLTPGLSPYPDFQHPTPAECEEVNRLLSTVHGEIKAPSSIPQPSLTVTGCGEVPSVLDALIRTILSGATTGANAAISFRGLVQRFGLLESGIGKGSVDWNAVREAPINDVFQAMKSGGLATTKSKYIKEILDMVYEENQQRKAAHIKSEESGEQSGPIGADHESKAQKDVEIALTDENVLSLDWIHSLDKEQAMLELIKYPGIGPKTAACVILFCLQRPCFAVDTHIFRICKWLGWLPRDGRRVTEVTAFSHLEVRIPDQLKYALHQLLIRHGKGCPRCRAITGEKSEGWETGCVIDHLVIRTGKRKGELFASN
jgi:endonuclease III